jgi:hypothetical protein
MTDHQYSYFVSFFAGTGGRFISGILWSMIRQTEYITTFSKHNSSHSYGEWCRSWGGDYTGNSDIYSKFNFSESAGIKHTHIYPNFEQIRNRFSNVKIIIISFEIADIPELVANGVHKNGFERIQDGSRELNAIKDIYKELYGKEFGTIFTLDEIEAICKYRQKFFESKGILNARFTNLPIPNDFLDKTLVIPYKKIFEQNELGGYTTLNQLAEFTGSQITDNHMKSFQSYVEGRKNFINNYAPWISL